MDHFTGEQIDDEAQSDKIIIPFGLRMGRMGRPKISFEDGDGQRQRHQENPKTVIGPTREIVDLGFQKIPPSPLM